VGETHRHPHLFVLGRVASKHRHHVDVAATVEVSTQRHRTDEVAPDERAREKRVQRAGDLLAVPGHLLGKREVGPHRRMMLDFETLVQTRPRSEAWRRTTRAAGQGTAVD
jgi:hypothetical protein